MEVKGPIVVKVSGSLLTPLRPSYLVEFRKAVTNLLADGYRLGIVTGGGRTAREYIAPLRELGVGESLLDEVGIAAARLNALALALSLLPHASPRVPTTLVEALEIYERGLVPVLGGLQPGQSTNAVALELAEALGAKLVVNLLNGVDGVYDRNPSEPGAVKYDLLDYDAMEDIVSAKESYAGTYELFDKVALEVARRSSIRVIFMNGANPGDVVAAVKGLRKLGTLLGPKS